MSCVATQCSFSVLCDAYVAAIILRVVLVIIVFLMVVNSRPEVSAVIIVFLLKLC